ncbi:hypothetical protein A2865_01555 [Candidatus Woesebacteria bacterium RIFCSPHIGHO2_01_FULL_39_17]|uniref:Phosphoribosyltransferase domain-containing protein n=1 Tax=Candidatus Woesebacteria bacterium RIFCSPLOWO2_01_FULL_39_14 TaxID=1802518 RepID=A0A1F8BDC6_9BACT|nr:MAG: hypothetical protein A2865_01555 [Candidatus Woesebacteria bacterium RIFCSPHIGHO2_01_FULL_39_17]OGM62013.1 MAG: hypothetical protein A3A52_02015 [Candidatus Woesebacteria bacterium RIFCSPLOWO2_01_FULL_39_14]
MFQDRVGAGVLLAEELSKYEGKKNVVVLGIPRGGVFVAKVVSDKLKVPLDVVVTKKIGAPYQEELAIGAVGPEGSLVLDSKLINDLGVDEEYIENKAKEKSDEIVERLIKFRKAEKIKLYDKTIILVDDGIATGATVEVAIKYLRKKKVGKIVLAVPVAPKESLVRFRKVVDEMLVLQTPFSFRAVGQFYRDFPQITDKEVIELLKK